MCQWKCTVYHIIAMTMQIETFETSTSKNVNCCETNPSSTGAIKDENFQIISLTEYSIKSRKIALKIRSRQRFKCDLKYLICISRQNEVSSRLTQSVGAPPL